MDERFLKLENESRERYIHRMYSNKVQNNLTNNEVKDIINEVLGVSWQESYMRGIYKNFDKGYNEALEEKSEDSYLQELEEKTLEFQKEKKKMQDQRREFKKYVDSQARFEHLLETMRECIFELNDTNPVKYNKFKGVNELKSENNEGVLICSDWHIGAKFDNILGRYDYNIAKNRIEDLLATTISYCEINKVKTLHIELLGDMLSGAIHISSKVEAEEDVMSQLMKLCKLLEDFIWELADKIPQVKVYTAIGNHSRLCPNIKDNQDGENFERLIPFFLKNRFEGKVSNIEICEDNNLDDCIVLFDVLDTKIFGVHGDLDKPNEVVNNMIKLFKVIPDEIHMGHYHTDMEKTEYDMSVIVNGSLQGTDTFAKKIRKSGSPLQKLIIYNNEGQICEYKMRLK
jgi:hypothetical protein